jgi:hypothetical protein
VFVIAANVCLDHCCCIQQMDVPASCSNLPSSAKPLQTNFAIKHCRCTRMRKKSNARGNGRISSVQLHRVSIVPPGPGEHCTDRIKAKNTSLVAMFPFEVTRLGSNLMPAPPVSPTAA